MNLFDKLTQDQLKNILVNVKQKGENLQIQDAQEMINEIKKQIMASLNQDYWEIERYEENI
jgi:cell division GTPase FtsZ